MSLYLHENIAVVKPEFTEYISVTAIELIANKNIDRESFNTTSVVTIAIVHVQP